MPIDDKTSAIGDRPGRTKADRPAFANRHSHKRPSAASTPTRSSGQPTPTQSPDRNPGDDAPPGTVGTGEDVCQRCAGSGRIAGGQDCPDCEGTGVVIQGIGGG